MEKTRKMKGEHVHQRTGHCSTDQTVTFNVREYFNIQTRNKATCGVAGYHGALGGSRHSLVGSDVHYCL